MKKWEERTISREHDYSINRHTICDYAKSIKVGSTIKVTDDRKATVKKKYPHIVLTDKGAYMWSDIYFINVLGHRLQTFGYEFFRPRESEDSK